MSEKEKTTNERKLNWDACDKLGNFMKENSIQYDYYHYMENLIHAYGLVNEKRDDRSGKCSKAIIKSGVQEEGFEVSLYQNLHYDEFRSVMEKVILSELDEYFDHMKDRFSPGIVKLMDIESLIK